jgi:FAD/FMN-containing dehydrogenase
MTTDDRRGLQRRFGELFGSRFRPHGSDTGPLGEFTPVRPEEVARLSEMAARHELSVIAAGGGTAPAAPEPPHNSIVARLGLMQNIELRHDGGGWAKAGPGTLWLALDNELRRSNRGLTVYPTSAPRATVGGWLATDGLGIGSFEHGWLRENVLAAEVVLPGGELREIPGGEVPDFVDTARPSGIIVAATLRTRRADMDRPFAVAFERLEDLLNTLRELSLDPVSTPLWHVGFLNPGMARIRGLTENYLMFGSYPSHRAPELEDVFWPAVSSNSGASLAPPASYRVWGERFSPLIPLRPTPRIKREFTSIESLLSPGEPGTWTSPVQGTLSRSGEVLILGLEDTGPGGELATDPERDVAGDERPGQR